MSSGTRAADACSLLTWETAGAASAGRISSFAPSLSNPVPGSWWMGLAFLLKRSEDLLRCCWGLTSFAPERPRDVVELFDSLYSVPIRCRDSFWPPARDALER